jgi:hypothetical protein
MNENADAWDALGEAFHKRLERNYVTWCVDTFTRIVIFARLLPRNCDGAP